MLLGDCLLVSSGRLAIGDPRRWKDAVLAHSGLQVISPTVDEMMASAELPPHHSDPFDRLLVAQAQARNLVLVTRDQHIANYDVATLWS